ncbi:MAG: DUF892 family protein [Verrucomicrobiaceae bacterium]|nr:MAG: DUF892 family protein [Verrucomicrobiaceae bacterium]
MQNPSALALLTELVTDLLQIQLQLIKWLPVLSDRANHPGLRHLIGKHVDQSRAHAGRLHEFFTARDATPVTGISQAIKLIIEDSGNKNSPADPDRADLLHTIQILRVEQFEITSYEIVARVADQLGFEMESGMLLEFLAERDASASVLRDLQGDLLNHAFPTVVGPPPPFDE